jgi:hypothetical protein
MLKGLPQASFISMVDAVFCTVSIIIILMVMIPQNQSRVGQIAQADLTVSCAMRDPLDYKVQIRNSADAGPAPQEIHITSEMDFPAAVIAVRSFVDRELARLDRLSARVGVVFAGRDRICVDAIVCALARRSGECPRSDVDIREEALGGTIPIVTIVFTGASVGDRR